MKQSAADQPPPGMHRGRVRLFRIVAGTIATIAAEAALYGVYAARDARFHWFTHLFVGASTALLVMSALAAHRRRPIPLPLLWTVLAHLYAMTPDFLFADHVSHQRWMDVFLGHISSHLIPGRNLTWYSIFLLALGCYLIVVGRMSSQPWPAIAARPGDN